MWLQGELPTLVDRLMLTRNCSVSVLLRQPALIRWTTYMDECLKQLENGSTSYAGDKWTCSVARLQRIMEEIKFMLDLDGESPNISFAEPRVQYQVKMFESQLSNWRQTVPADIDQRKALINESGAILMIYRCCRAFGIFGQPISS